MNIRVSITVKEPMVSSSKSALVCEFSRQLNNYFQDRNYGADIELIAIGLIMTFVRQGYEEWHKPERIKYTRYKMMRNRLTGEAMEIDRTLSYEIKFSELEVVNFGADDDAVSMEILIAAIRASLANLDKLPKGLTDFDAWRFKEDLCNYFQGLQG